MDNTLIFILVASTVVRVIFMGLGALWLWDPSRYKQLELDHRGIRITTSNIGLRISGATIILGTAVTFFYHPPLSYILGIPFETIIGGIFRQMNNTKVGLVFGGLAILIGTLGGFQILGYTHRYLPKIPGMSDLSQAKPRGVRVFIAGLFFASSVILFGVLISL